MIGKIDIKLRTKSFLTWNFSKFAAFRPDKNNKILVLTLVCTFYLLHQRQPKIKRNEKIFQQIKSNKFLTIKDKKLSFCKYGFDLSGKERSYPWFKQTRSFHHWYWIFYIILFNTNMRSCTENSIVPYLPVSHRLSAASRSLALIHESRSCWICQQIWLLKISNH